MIPKMTIEEFLKIKETLQTNLLKIQEEAQELYNKELPEEEIEQETFRLVAEYMKDFYPLLDYDLSDIPFEMWEGISILVLDEIDFSKTKANLDFSLLEDFVCEKGAILKGCNLRNLRLLQAPLLERFFDEATIAENQELFLSSIFSPEFKEKYGKKELRISDLFELNESQISELETKEYRRRIEYNMENPDMKYYDLLSEISLSKLIKLHSLNPELLSDIAGVYKSFGSYLFEHDLAYLFEGELNLELIEEKIHEIFEENILYGPSFTLRENLFSEKFISKHPNIFPDKNKLPKELLDKITKRELTMEDLIEHHAEFGELNVKLYLAFNYEVNTLVEILEDNFLYLIGKFPNIFRNYKEIIFKNDLSYKLKRNYLSEMRRPDKSIEEKFINALLKTYYGDNNLEFSPNATPDIYAETEYPDWVKEIGYYLSKLEEMNDYHLPIISSKTEITSPNLKKLFDTLGLSNIKRMYDEDFFFTPDIIEILEKSIERVELESATSFEDFQDKLMTLIFSPQSYDISNIYKELNALPENHSLRKRHSDMFVSVDAPEELKKLFYTKEPSIFEITKNKEWIPYLKDLNFKKLNISFEINIINSEQKGNMLPPQPYDLITLFSKESSLEEFLIYFNEYKFYFKNMHQGITIDVANTSKESIINQTADRIADYIIGNLFTPINPNGPQSLKDRHPELFLPDNAPEDLKDTFYKGYLRLDNIRKNPDWLDYLSGINPHLIRDLPLNVGAINSEFQKPQPVQIVSLYDIYIKKYGLKEYINFITPYLNTINRNGLKSGVIDLIDPSKEAIEKEIEKYAYECIVKHQATFGENFTERFKTTYPDIFLPLSAPAGLKEKYYSRELNFEDIRLNPEYKDYLKDIDLVFAFAKSRFLTTTNDIYPQSRVSIPNVLEYISKDTLLELFACYGHYFTGLGIRPEFLKTESIEELKQKIEEEIINRFSTPNNRTNYTINYDENAPDFLKQKYPDFFLDPSAPEELKNYFYRVTPNYQLSISLIGKHKEWLPFLKDKNLIVALEKINNHRSESIKYIELFGQDQGLKLAVNRNETVTVMINSNKVEVMHSWWLKTGKKFIPDYIVMQNLPLTDIDKFLSHGKEWSQLMRNKRFSQTKEGKDALIKLAYSFGVFDGDIQGSKKLDSLLNDIPRRLKEDDMKILLEMEQTIQEDNENKRTIGKEEYLLLRSTLQSEGFEISGPSIFSELYKNNEDGTYSLIINNQSYPKSRELLRSFMEKNNLSTVISADRAHILFGGFAIKYDRDFREFLLANLEEFITNVEYVKFIPAIQKQFQEIKVVNSNRVLTIDLAISYVQENKYLNVNVGNDELAKVAGMAGYSQADFDTLQQIYAYGKARVTSSIPRIEGKTDKFNYEILRLTDPLAIGIGTLTDCCQEIRNAAELCMEHSMVDKNGRLFLITDKEGNFVSQSWVWRNGNVLCFDNIEIPDKQLLKSGMPRHLVGTGSRNEFTDQVLEIYKLAAKELIAEDEKVLKELLEAGKITEEQYEKYRLRKVTVGSGYNDVGASIKASFKQDKEQLARPLPFKPPVELDRDLYTNDSTTQYVLENNQERTQYVDSTLPVHYDDFKVLDYTNITRRDVYLLEKLEYAHGRNRYSLNTAASDLSSPKTIMDEISSNYGCDLSTLKIILTPSFAIMYNETPQEIVIVDAIMNDQLENETQLDKIKLQFKLALLQIARIGKKVNTESNLYYEEKKLIEEIMNISEEQVDNERGISHGI